jgi:hypothetical protein
MGISEALPSISRQQKHLHLTIQYLLATSLTFYLSRRQSIYERKQRNVKNHHQETFFLFSQF